MHSVKPSIIQFRPWALTLLSIKKLHVITCPLSIDSGSILLYIPMHYDIFLSMIKHTYPNVFDTLTDNCYSYSKYEVMDKITYIITFICTIHEFAHRAL